MFCNINSNLHYKITGVAQINKIIHRFKWTADPEYGMRKEITLASQFFDNTTFTKPGPATEQDSIISEEGRFFMIALEI